MKKTDAIICGSKARQRKVSVDLVHTGQSVIPFSNTVRDLEFFFDKNLLMTDHISAVVRWCFFLLYCLCKLHQYRQVQNRATRNVTQSGQITLFP